MSQSYQCQRWVSRLIHIGPNSDSSVSLISVSIGSFWRSHFPVESTVLTRSDLKETTSNSFFRIFEYFLNLLLYLRGSMFLVRLFEIDPFDSMTYMLWLHTLLPVFYTAVEEPLRSLAADLDQWTDRKTAQWDIDLKKIRHFEPKLTLLEFNNSNPNPTRKRFLKLCPIRKRNLFFIFGKLWKLYS